MNIAIILNYNDADMVRAYLKRNKGYSSIDKFIIVDNFSTDNSWEKLQNLKCEKVDLVRASENRGYSAGNNIGIKYALSKYPNVSNIIISNPDIYIKDEDIKAIENAVSRITPIATGIIYNYDEQTGSKSLASNFCWDIPRYRDMIIELFLITHKIAKMCKKSIYKDYKDFDGQDIIVTQAVPGCFFIMKSDLIKTIGYLDEGTFLFGEETILGFRLKQENYKCVLVKKAEILHTNGGTINKEIRITKDKEKILLDSYCYYLEKYLKINRLSINIYKILFRIGRIEKRMVSIIQRRMRNVKVNKE